MDEIQIPQFDEDDLYNFINDIEENDDEVDLDNLLNNIEHDVETSGKKIDRFEQSVGQIEEFVDELSINQEAIRLLNSVQKDTQQQHENDSSEKGKRLVSKLKAEVDKNPSNYELRRKYAEALFDHDFLDDALIEFNLLLNIFKNDHSIVFSIGLVYDKLNEFDKAKLFYINAIELMPEEPDFHYNLAFLLDRHGYIDEAIKEYIKTLRLDPDDQHTHFNIGCLFSKKSQHNEAIHHLEKAIEINNADVYAHYYLAYEYKKIGKISCALAGYNKVLALSPEYSWAYYNIGCIYYETGKIEQAVPCFEKVFEINPKDIEALKITVSILIKFKEYKRAINNLELGLDHNPNNGEIFYQLSRVQKAQNNLEEAVFLLKKALENSQSLNVKVENVESELIALQQMLS